MEITEGSLFDGIAGFPLAGLRNGIRAIWASEIESFPIKVSKAHFPEMKHLGDITKINGAEIEPVEIVTGGSPCQDLSIAGKRAGLAGKRSGLFMEQVRIVQEMREHDKRIGRTGVNIRPRFMLWENVPGAFSSNKGEDFRAVLEETARIADETAVIPGPPKGKWNTAGCIMGDDWSIAWRVLDAQFWGVPQRRRRIYLVADFGGQSAPEILFKREGLRRHLEASREAREGAAACVERGIGKAVGFEGDIARTLTARHDSSPCADRGQNVVAIGFSWRDNGRDCGDGVSPTMRACNNANSHICGSGNLAIAIDSNCQDSRFKITGKIVPTIPAKSGTGGNNGPMLAVPLHEPSPALDASYYKGCGERAGIEREIVATYQSVTGPLMANSHPGSYTRQDAYNDMLVAGVDCRNLYENTEKSGTLQKNGNSLNAQNPIRIGYSVRRLTPLECDRLQDYPDGWTDIPGASDSARYKADGNSIAVCCADYVLEGIKEILTS